MGTTTAGKGSIVCEPVAMTNGSAVAFTVGKLLDHNGQSFDGTGVAPDVEVPLTTEEERNYYNYTVDSDPQIAKGLRDGVAAAEPHAEPDGIVRRGQRFVQHIGPGLCPGQRQLSWQKQKRRQAPRTFARALRPRPRVRCFLQK